MKNYEKFVLEHGNIETLCCFVEDHYESLSDDMKNLLSSYRDRLSDKLKTNTDPNDAIYDLSLADFFNNYTYAENPADEYYFKKCGIRAQKLLKQNNYETLRDVLKVPRSKVHKIHGFGDATNAFSGFKYAMEKAGLDPYMVIK
ncbi:MAG: hypothetical protein IJ660_03220 [Alphaproteobacteria bacterium]|nr:hypothetical protein [Alphaproteobacteria bacterium]